MFTVGFDVSALDPHFREHAWRGIGRYVRQLRASFQNLAPANIKIEDFEHNTFIPRSLIDCLPFGRVTVEQQLFFPLQLWWQGRDRFDVLHFPAHMDAPAWCRLPYIITVLDLIPLVLADLYKADRPGWRFNLARSLEIQAIKNASLILAISENTARDVHNILGVPREHIRVTPLAVDQRFFAMTDSIDESSLRLKLKIPPARPIILYVGGIDPRKNYAMLLSVMREISNHFKAVGQQPPVLVMAGGIEKDLQYPRLLKLIEELSLKDDIVLTGFVEDQELLQLYSISTLFLFLSLYEGFGLGVLEAMARGLPVVAGNNSCIPEVAQDQGVLVDVSNREQIVRAVLDLIGNPNRCKELAERGRKQANKFNWDRTAELTLSAYREFDSSNRIAQNA